MRMAIRQSGLDPSLIGYINAHATSTPSGPFSFIFFYFILIFPSFAFSSLCLVFVLLLCEISRLGGDRLCL
jgi:hypothetical protein